MSHDTDADAIDLNRPPDHRLDDNHGTSTSDEEAPLRDIGRDAFGITYPRDITPARRKRLTPSVD